MNADSLFDIGREDYIMLVIKRWVSKGGLTNVSS